MIVIIGLLEMEFSIPEARSLKDKRSVIKSLKDRIAGKMNVSVAEIDHQDQWQRSRFAFVTVAAEKHIVESRMAELRDRLLSDPRYVIMGMEQHFL